MLETEIAAIRRRQDLTREEATACAEALLGGTCPEETVIALLGSLADKGETVEEIVGFALGLMRHCLVVDLPGRAVDLCGTGGSGKARFNYSTAASFVLASGGWGVAKHGNRGSRQPNGSVDFLEALGLPVSLPPDRLAMLFDRHHLCFLFARAHHPAMKHVGPARARLGRRSIFNLVGPLCNPAKVRCQVVGASDAATAGKVAQALLGLGRRRAMAVHGHPGIDEFSLCGPTRAWVVQEGRIEEREYRPEDFGFQVRSWESLPSGDAVQNAALFRRLLAGEELDGLLDMVALNAAAGIWAHEACPDLREGVAMARSLLKSGRTRDFFEAYSKAAVP